ncbi:hypothetical protein [Ideonella sp. B508-1]|uniref:hypothetical protein n=1 Tax=Ideonella sp. B508-1 TaxID=137716 RepID=UPI0011D2972F|nr:hypothetical protein [Ideonella sp. B508-1]
MTHLFEKSRAAAAALVVTVVGFGPVRGAMAVTPSFPEGGPSVQSAALVAQQEMLSDLTGKLAVQTQLLHAQRKVLAGPPHVAMLVRGNHWPQPAVEP